MKSLRRFNRLSGSTTRKVDRIVAGMARSRRRRPSLEGLRFRARPKKGWADR